ncbi:MAG: bis(5'-nucleosyl)-tetraphosphatase (symmetrical) YqeK [Candidatus Baltobacteraceae bacterium]
MAQDHRYAHSVRVARFAERLAFAYGESTFNARLAGMLHDLARLYSSHRLLEESQSCGLSIDAYAESNPIVLHAPLSAHLAREQFGISDSAVLSAISKHTLGAAEMSPLDCILYLADSLEPGRAFADRPRLAALAFENLELAMAQTIKSSFGFLWEKGLEPAPQTLEAASMFGLQVDLGETFPSRS